MKISQKKMFFVDIEVAAYNSAIKDLVLSEALCSKKKQRRALYIVTRNKMYGIL
jgi:hypothetical protein